VDTATRLNGLASQLGELLAAAGYRVTSAESCTGGWIAKVMTDIAGSSRWFDCGFVTYSNAAKQAMVGVQSQTLARHGAVSEAVVREMALGALARSDAEVGVAVSGVAGPGGGTADKPVGTVWFAWCTPQAAVASERRLFAGDREAVRRQAVEHALRGLLVRLRG
jgi:nicotinamide-nucleotide amidase